MFKNIIELRIQTILKVVFSAEMNKSKIKRWNAGDRARPVVKVILSNSRAKNRIWQFVPASFQKRKLIFILFFLFGFR